MEENHMRNLLVAQSGGPTAAINATVAGVVSCAVLSGKVDHIYGAVNGIEGVLAEKFLDLGKKLDSAEKISLLMQTPAAALGSCRYKLGDPKENTEDFEEILRIFRRHEIRYFIYIGGNDSMDTVNKLSKYCKENGVEVCLLSAHQRRSTTTSSERITARALAPRQNIWQQPLPSWKETATSMRKRQLRSWRLWEEMPDG